MLKICKRCSIEKDLNSYNKNIKSKDGLQSYCKDCVSLYGSKYRSLNKEKLSSKKKLWKLNNKDKTKQYNYDYEKKRKSIDPDFKLLKNLRARNRGGLKRSLDNSKSSSYKIVQLFKIQDFNCAYCSVDISESNHIDHIIPLSKSGSNLITNLALACPDCNMTKSNKDLDIWLKEININYDYFVLKLNERNNLYFKDEIDKEVA